MASRDLCSVSRHPLPPPVAARSLGTSPQTLEPPRNLLVVRKEPVELARDSIADTRHSTMVA